MRDEGRGGERLKKCVQKKVKRVAEKSDSEIRKESFTAQRRSLCILC